MKKIRFEHNIVSLLLTVAGTLTFSACSDDLAKDATPSAIDPKQWNLDANMDTSVKPGDDFARYCWGKWYDAQGEATDGGLSIFYEAINETNKKVAQLGLKEREQMARELASLGENETGMELLRQNISSLLELRRCGTSSEIAAELGKFLAIGKSSSLSLEMQGYGDRNYVYLDHDPSTYFASDITKLSDNSNDSLVVAYWLAQLGMDEMDAAAVLEDGLVQDFYEHERSTASSNSTQYDEIGKAFCQGLGINTDQLIYFPDNSNYSSINNVGYFIEMNARHIVDMMICHEAADILLASRDAYEKYIEERNSSDGKFISAAIDPLLSYPLSKAFCDKYCTEEMRSKVLGMMEDLRTAFASRIDQLTWMSSTTKQEAKTKLNAMKFHALYPDNWISAGFPNLKGGSLYEDMQILRQTRANLKKEILSRNAREDLMNYSVVIGFPTYTVNCFYEDRLNAVAILSPFVMSPYYSSENSDATLYAIGTTLGHEMTHGFDSEGSHFGPKGEDVNWWTVSDKQEYDERTQLLLDCYNHLPGYMECPGSTFTDGKKTLAENIADLGGLEIALQAYTAKLEQQGYYGDELVKQQKHFFQAYANLWRSKYGLADNLYWLEYDEHANDYTRLIGSTMNCNRWYELYDVQWGDKYYLKPEKRTHIW